MRDTCRLNILAAMIYGSAGAFRVNERLPCSTIHAMAQPVENLPKGCPRWVDTAVCLKIIRI